MMPIAAIACQSRGIEAQHRTDLSGAQSGNQTIEAGPFDSAVRSSAKIVVDHFDVAEPTSTCDFDQFVLAPLTLKVQLDLSRRRLAHIDDRLALQNDCWQESVIRCHRRPPALPCRCPRAGGVLAPSVRPGAPSMPCPESHVVECEVELE